MTTYLIYIDDSGAESTGIAAFGWFAVPTNRWSEGLGDLLQWRADLDHETHIPVTYELHATKFAGGRGRPTTVGDGSLSKAERARVLTESFTRFALFDWITVGSSYTHARSGHRYHDEKVRAYRDAIERIETWLEDNDSTAIVIMDGDGSDKALARAHRTLPRRTRRVLEDPLFLDSATSQWVQVADLIAYAAYQSVLHDRHRAFAWPWYPALSSVDAFKGPVATA